MKEPVRLKARGNTEQWKTGKQRRKWKRGKLELSPLDSKAEDKPVSDGLGPPWASHLRNSALRGNSFSTGHYMQTFQPCSVSF